MRYTVMSDWHLGCGDAREDFLRWGGRRRGPQPAARPEAMAALEEVLAELLSSREAGAGHCLLLLGDIVDLWQVQRRGESVAGALARILAAHPAVVAALRAWIAAGGELLWLLGNHDHALCDAAAWGLLREALPGLNRLRGGAPAWFHADVECGFVAAHGHQWDPVNRIVGTRPNAPSIGRTFVRQVLNRLEPAVPWIDKAADFRTAARIALAHAESPAGDEVPVPPPLHAAQHLLAQDGDALAACVAARRRRWVRRHVLARNVSRVLCGHTHAAGVETDGDGVSFHNAGTWRPVLVPLGGRSRVEQPLDWMAIDDEGPAAAITHHRAGWPPPPRGGGVPPERSAPRSEDR